MFLALIGSVLLVQYLVPVNLLDLHTCLVAGDVLGHCGNVVECRHIVDIDFDTKGVLDKSLQANLVERVHCKVGLDVICAVYGDLLFLLYVVLQYLVLVAGRLGGCLYLGCVVFATPCKDVLQLVSLQLVQLGAWQVAAVYHNGHQFLVAWCVQVVWFQHLALEGYFQFGVVALSCPQRLWNDNSAQHVSVLCNGCFLDLLLEFLQFVFYFAGLYVLAVGEDYDFLAAACKYNASVLVKACDVASVQITVLVYYGRSFLGTVVISLHYVGTLDAELTFFGCLLAAVKAYKLAVYAGEGQACTSRYVVTGACEGDDGCCLGHSVAFKQAQSQCLQSASDLAVQCGASAYAVFQVATHFLVQAVEYDA